MDPVAKPPTASQAATRRIALAMACPLAVVALFGISRPADAVMLPPPVRLPVLHGVDGWAGSAASMRILSERAAAEVRIVPVPETWKA